MKHLVQMHKKLGKDGMVALTICVNEFEEPWPKAEQTALKLLKKEGIGANNFLLKLEREKAGKHLHLSDGYPCVFIFNRQGQWKQFFGADIEPNVDQWTERFLKAK